MPPHLKQCRSSTPESSIHAQAASPGCSLQTQNQFDRIPLPPSQSIPPDILTQDVSIGAAFQGGSSRGQNRKQATREGEVGREEAGNQEEAEALDAASVDEKLLKASNPFAIGHKKLAEFWPVYVKVTDAHDKELSKGWNNMLDIILIFAALFSAISTAFVVESSKDLKPNPAESAAATLLLISQTLLTMSNQSAPVPAAISPQSSLFVPSGSALAVNVLWFTSLILSISVTLMAMLAKEWSYLFMAGRTGTPMEQARKRQKRFDEMEAWKMAGVITALPTLMHLALFLFAAGLCVHLWNIHIGVAVPVVVLTLTTALIYVGALVLPLVYEYCPYATTLSKLVKPYLGVWLKKQKSQPDSDVSSCKAPMDATTSRTLAWMISNSEVSEYVDLALQAIAGTSFEMPNEALREMKITEAIRSRLWEHLGDTCSGSTRRLRSLQKSEPAAFTSTLAYAQALNLIVEREEQATARPGLNNIPKHAAHMLIKCHTLYSELCGQESPYIKVVGYLARLMCRQHEPDLPFAESDHLLDVSRVAVDALQRQGPLASGLICSSICTTLRSAATRWDNPTELSAQRREILEIMPVILSLSEQKGLSPSEYRRAVAMVGLAMNRGANTLLGVAAELFFASDTQGVVLQKYSSMWVLLGLSGLSHALKSDQLFELAEGSNLELDFSSLLTHFPEAGAPANLSLDALGDTVDQILGVILRREHEPWLAPIAAALLEYPASDFSRNSCVKFVAQNEPSVIEAGSVLLSNAFYEAARLEDTDARTFGDDVLRLTQHFEIVSANNGQTTRSDTHNMLRRLLRDKMFRNLFILMVRTRLTGALRRWQGMKVGYIMRFWGEHIIQWGRSTLQEGESSGDANSLREFFASEEEIKDQFGSAVVGATNLKDLLWQAINLSEDPPITLDSRIFRWAHMLWRNRRAEDAAVPASAQPV